MIVDGIDYLDGHVALTPYPMVEIIDPLGETVIAARTTMRCSEPPSEQELDEWLHGGRPARWGMHPYRRP